jgi:hypothetical protein
MADGQITLRGQPCLLSVAEFQEWFDTWLPLSDLQCLVEPLYRHNGRLDSRSGNTNPVGLPRPNYPPLPIPPVKLNTLYWPTGATRWAFMFLVVDGDIQKAIGTDVTPKALVLSDGDTTLTTNMYVLPPRRITATVPSGRNAWLLPLVDHRYWWQFKNTSDLEVLTTTTWTELFTLLADAIGGSGSTIAHDAIPSEYLRPDPQELFRAYENAAAMLDAAAHSVGHRVTRRLNGSIHSRNWTTSGDQFFKNAQSAKAANSILGGFDFSQDQIGPDRMQVVFPRMREYRPYAERPYSIESPVRPSVHVETIPLAGTIFGTTKTVHSTCFALTSATSTTVTNTAQLSALALRIATDFEDSLIHSYDYTFGGLVDWTPCGYDDHIEWTIGRLHPGPHGDYLVRTRVQSAPYNFGSEEQLSQQSTQFVLPDFGTGVLYDPLSPGAQVTVSVYYYDDIDEHDWVDTNVNIECFENIMKPGSATVAAGKRCYFKWDRNSNRWLIINVECP